MTNKTEIAELRQNFSDAVSREKEWEIFYTVIDLFKDQADRLEAAEARIDEQKQQYDLIVNSHVNRAEKAEAEIAAIRGSAAPVGYFARRPHEEINTGTLIHARGKDTFPWSSVEFDPVFTHPAPPATRKINIVTLPKLERAEVNERDFYFYDASDIQNCLRESGIAFKSADGKREV